MSLLGKVEQHFALQGHCSGSLEMKEYIHWESWEGLDGGDQELSSSRDRHHLWQWDFLATR